MRRVKYLETNDDISYEFVNFLGESKYVHGLDTIPPSRFSNSNSNGLWEYSPFLCGVGLMEALEIAYTINCPMWDDLSEPMCTVHLHNMLVQRGHIKEPVGLYRNLERIQSEAFFSYSDGFPPKTYFRAAFDAQCTEGGSRRLIFERNSLQRYLNLAPNDIHGILNVQTNRFFKEKSLLLVLREVGWVPDRIPDKDIKPNSTIGMLRLIQTKRVTDPVTGQQRLENTDLVKRAGKVGYSDDFIMHTASGLENVLEWMNGGRFSAEAAKAVGAPEGYKTFTNEHLQQQNSMVPNDMHGKKTLPELLKYDLNNDVCGKAAPLSSLNYVAATMQKMMMFTKIEEELRRIGNPSYLYSRSSADGRETLVLDAAGA